MLFLFLTSLHICLLILAIDSDATISCKFIDDAFCVFSNVNIQKAYFHCTLILFKKYSVLVENELSGSGVGARIDADQCATDVINLKHMHPQNKRCQSTSQQNQRFNTRSNEIERGWLPFRGRGTAIHCINTSRV